jgi:hypothetical protein
MATNSLPDQQRQRQPGWVMKPSRPTRRVARGTAVVAVLAAVLLSAVAAPAADTQARWHTVAARSKFPIYRPKQTLGLKLSILKLYPCLVTPRGTRYLAADYGKPGGKGPHFGAWEMYPYLCGNPGEANPVTSAVIKGVKVKVLVFCRSPGPTCTIKDGFKNGFLLYLRERGAKRTRIQLIASHVSLSDFLKIARSFTKVP